MEFVKEILEEQKTMLTDEIKWADSEGYEFTEINQRLEEVNNALLILNSSSLQLPCEEEMLMKRHYELIKSKENLTYVDNGSFYAGFRRCFNWLKPYEVDGKAIV